MLRLSTAHKIKWASRGCEWKELPARLVADQDVEEVISIYKDRIFPVEKLVVDMNKQGSRT